MGDLATDEGRYESVGAPVYWIHGNNDNVDAIAAGDLPPELHHIPNGTSVFVGGPERPALHLGGAERPALHPGLASRDGGRTSQVRLHVAGLGGTFAPTWYETPPAERPHPKRGTAKATALADKRRHFVREEVDACTRLRGVDVFLSHEAAKPFRAFPGGPAVSDPATAPTSKPRGPDAGKAQINEVLAAMQPRLHLFGHHHRFTDEVREGIRSVGLDLVARSYLLVDATSLDIHLRQIR